ncbi:MAG TPA: DUF2007 domain-containing protein [Chromatiales bacterium]|nr:DUF2007 domain-containing protein [Thiotrichales bacterium]HIP68137.1 DUF2007 domain-containing protein [Chromatiales bacterium]
MKLIYKAGNITEAHIVSGLLNSNGIKTHVGGHYLQGGVGELAAFDFAHVHVEDEDVQAAQSIIAEYEGKKSKPIKHTKITNNNPARGLVIVAFVLLLVILIFYLISN